MRFLERLLVPRSPAARAGYVAKDAEYLAQKALASMKELGVTPEQVRTVLGYQRNRNLIGKLLLARGPEKDAAMLEFRGLPDAQRAIVGGAYAELLRLALTGDTESIPELDLPTEVL